jgi:hypothetical protein
MAKVELLEVIDMTEFVAEQRQKVQSGDLAGLVTPLERIYAPVLAGE